MSLYIGPGGFLSRYNWVPEDFKVDINRSQKLSKSPYLGPRSFQSRHIWVPEAFKVAISGFQGLLTSLYMGTGGLGINGSQKTLKSIYIYVWVPKSIYLGSRGY